jgi:flagella basal body P-ring formation protein FlgA
MEVVMRQVLIFTLWLGALAAAAAAAAQERFVPRGTGSSAIPLELRAEASVRGEEVRLRHIARWMENDDDAMAQAADLVVARFGQAATLRIDLDNLKDTLEGAGINLAALRFSGAAQCQVRRIDQRLVTAVEQAAASAAAQAGLLTDRAASSTPVAPAAAGGVAGRTLGQILTAEVAERFGIPADSMQVRFQARDQKLVELAEPQFRFEVEPRRQRNIGWVTWDVEIVTDAGRQRASITADVRVWQTQLFTAVPLAFRQPIGASDVVERRVLVDRLADEPPLTREQVVGQEAARDLGPGVALTASMIRAVSLARPGDLVSVVVQRGGVRVTWVAEAREAGSYGQTIRVRKPNTREEFSVLLTGPQQGRLVAAVNSEPPSVAAAR